MDCVSEEGFLPGTRTTAGRVGYSRDCAHARFPAHSSSLFNISQAASSRPIPSRPSPLSRPGRTHESHQRGVPLGARTPPRGPSRGGPIFGRSGPLRRASTPLHPNLPTLSQAHLLGLPGISSIALHASLPPGAVAPGAKAGNPRMGTAHDPDRHAPALGVEQC